ncbi:F-box and leucine-rich repeat protein 13 isoform X4 [Equus przewalskii]|uniref:F-box and leucine-rich repeat protein 13 isoform X4 n=1 Tax=Equus przewalskii TaxID=9798 RepID=A0ABM4P7H7_EQUPR
MASLRTASPTLRSYFKENYIPQVFEALLCGVLVTCPEDPLRYLEETIITIMESGLESLLWDMYIDPSMKPKIRRLSETYMERLFGLEDQLITPELMIKACTFYTGRLVKTHFCTWRNIAISRTNEDDMLAEKMEKATKYANFRLQKYIFHHWHSHAKVRKEQLNDMLLRIQGKFHHYKLIIILNKWREKARHRYKKREDELMLKHELQLKRWKSNLKGKTAAEEKFIFPERSMSEVFLIGCCDISALPERAVSRIFSHLSLRDTVVCGQVSRSWLLMTQIRSLWNAIDFSSVKHMATDKYIVSTLQRWRLNVLRLNFRGCALRQKTLRSVSLCKNLQELNVSDCPTLTVLPQLTKSQPGLLQKVHGQRFTVPEFRERMPQAHLFGPFRLHPDFSPRLQECCKQLHWNNASDRERHANSDGQLHKRNKRITDACFKFIDKNYPNISHIYMADCKGITDGSLRSLSPLKQLTVLNLANCVRIGDVGLRQFLDGPVSIRIRELNLNNCVHLGDASMVKLAERCPNLHYLSLRNCTHLTDIGIAYIVNIFSLLSIDLSGTDISDEGLITLSRHKKLRELSLSECNKITNLGVQVFCKGSLLLEHLDVSYCPQLSDDIIKVLAIYCICITSLSVAGCPKITDSAMEMLSAKCRYLHILDISGCVLLTDQMLKHLQLGCKQLRILKMNYCRLISKEAASRMSQKVQQQEYSPGDPPSWFGYDWEGNPLTEQRRIGSLEEDSESILKQSVYSSDEEAV